MAQEAENEKRTRIHMEVPERVRERIRTLQELSGADSITDVIRRALSVYDAVLTISRVQGRKLIVRDSDGKEAELLIV